MKKMVYTNTIDNEIIAHENNMLALYLEKSNKFKVLFEKEGYYLKLGLTWNHFPNNSTTLQRISFQNGYECYVYCVVRKEGKDVCVTSFDGEADYYSLSTAWMISSIFRKFFRLNVELYDNTDDMETDLSDFLSKLKDLPDT